MHIVCCPLFLPLVYVPLRILGGVWNVQARLDGDHISRHQFFVARVPWTIMQIQSQMVANVVGIKVPHDILKNLWHHGK